MGQEIWRLSAVEIAASIRDGKISCVEAVTSAVERMGAVNGSINAVVNDLGESALEQARDSDAVVRSGVELGPLHGVPVTIKENADQRGLPTPNGIPALAEVMSPDDSPVVTNMLEAGAIVIGRTNTPEFSLRWFTDNPLHGKTLNPWHPDITPGGSTGGGAAAVALGIGAIAHGSDLGGSLRYPAYACGLATIRPSLGRVPAYNPSGAEERPPTFQLMSVQGPIAREVRDVRLALATMARGDGRDPWWVPAPLEGPRMAHPIRVAVTKTPAGLSCHPAVADAVDQAAGILDAAGYAVEAVDPPLVAEVAECWRVILNTDTRMMVEPAIRQHGSADINAVHDGFQSAVEPRDLEGYVRALADRTRLIRAWTLFLEDYPLVLAPVSQVPPYPHDEDLKGSARVREMLDEQSMLYGINLLGLPSAAVPTGLHDGAPMGVQIIGPRFREDLCLDAAQAIETGAGVLTEKLLAQ